MKTTRHIVLTLTLTLTLTLAGALAVAGSATGASSDEAAAEPAIRSMSAISFGPDGILFVGDSVGGAIFAVELPAREPADWGERFSVADVEGKIAALLGTTADEVLIHDMAAHPRTRHIYLAVSRGRSQWTSRWMLPNDAANANLLLEIAPGGEIREVTLAGLGAKRAELPNPIDAEKKHPWKGVPMRTDTITDLAYADGVLYVAGLSNEEFASTLWKVPYPFASGVTATTLEIFHGAHGEFETQAPIRTFVPYTLRGDAHLLAAYLCTPFVTFKTSELADGKHVKGRTLGEFGSGNYPLDMVLYQKDGKDRLLIANSNLPLMIVKAEDLERFEGEIVEKPATYAAGLPYEVRSGTGIQQLDKLDDATFVALQRLPSGTMDLVSMPVRRF